MMYVAVLRTMEQEVVVHKGVKVYIFREEDQFSDAVQPDCAVMGGSMMYRFPRAQDPDAMFKDQAGHRVSIRWFSRTGTQLEQAKAVTDVVIPHLIKENVTDVTILLVLEEASLNGHNWEDTFPLLVTTLEEVERINRDKGYDFKLVAGPMVYPFGDNQRVHHAKVAAHNAAVEAFNHYIVKSCTWKSWRFLLNKCTHPAQDLRLAVEGMEHLSLAPHCYEEARIPSRSKMLKMRKTLRGFVGRGWAIQAADQPVTAPYRMKGPEDQVVLPEPTAVDLNGTCLPPDTAVIARVMCSLDGTPRQDWPTQPTISIDAYQHLSTERAQDIVDRRRGALGLDKKVETSARLDVEKAGTSTEFRRPSSASSRSRTSTSDLRETLNRRPAAERSPRTPARGPRTPPPRRSSRRSRSRSPQPRRHSTTAATSSTPATSRSRTPPTRRPAVTAAPTGGRGRGLVPISARRSPPRSTDKVIGPADKLQQERRRRLEKERLEQER